MGITEVLRRVDWLWMVIGGFYLLAYLFWYIPALKALPDSASEPSTPYPWHWTLDFLATGITGVVLLYLGFGRAAQLRSSEGTTSGPSGPPEA